VALITQGAGLVYITVAGRPVPDPFDAASGGDTTMEPRSYRSGGLADAEAYAIPATTEPYVIRRAFRGERDAPLRRWLIANQGAEVNVTSFAVGPDKRVIPATQESASGILGTITKPEYDSSSEDVQTYSVTIGISGGWS
jgi:hypothetical protein